MGSFFNTSRKHFGEVRETFSIQNLHLLLITQVLLELLRPIGNCAQLSGNDSTVQKVSLIEAPGLPSFCLNYNNRGIGCIVLGMAHTLHVLPIGFWVIAVTTSIMMVFGARVVAVKAFTNF